MTRAFLGWTTVVSGILILNLTSELVSVSLRERSGQGDPPSGAHDPLRSQGGRTLATGHRGRRPSPGMWGADLPEPVLCVPEGLKESRGGGSSGPRQEACGRSPEVKTADGRCCRAGCLGEPRGH